ISPRGQALGAVFISPIVFYGIFGAGLSPKSRLTSCSVFRQTAPVEAEIDCKLQSSSSWASERLPTTMKTKPITLFLCHPSGDKPAVRSLYPRLRRDGT